MPFTWDLNPDPTVRLVSQEGIEPPVFTAREQIYSLSQHIAIVASDSLTILTSSRNLDKPEDIPFE